MDKAVTMAAHKSVEGVSWAKEGIEKIRSKPWAEPAGMALGAAASICQGLGNFVPGVGIIGGALKMGSVILNPSPSLADLKRSEQELASKLSGETGILKGVIERELQDIREKIAQPQP